MKDYSVKGRMYIIKKPVFSFDKAGYVVIASFAESDIIGVNKKDVGVRCDSAMVTDCWNYPLTYLVPLEFNIGDIVKVRTVEEMRCRRDDVKYCFPSGMDIFCGKKAKIKKIEYKEKFKESSVELEFLDKEISSAGRGYNFSAEMLTKDISECKNKEYDFLVGENGILLQTPEEYKYIARDIDGNLCIFKNKPTKGQHYWESNEFEYFTIFNHLFENVKFEDKEPYKFR